MTNSVIVVGLSSLFIRYLLHLSLFVFIILKLCFDAIHTPITHFPPHLFVT